MTEAIIAAGILIAAALGFWLWYNGDWKGAARAAEAGEQAATQRATDAQDALIELARKQSEELHAETVKVMQMDESSPEAALAKRRAALDLLARVRGTH